MSDELQSTQVTYQAGDRDVDYIKLRLDMQELHKKIKNFLQGTSAYLVEAGSAGVYMEASRQEGEPLANKQGIQNIMSFVVMHVNEHTVQGNMEHEELGKLLTYIHQGLAQQLAMYYEDWGIDPSNRGIIMLNVMGLMRLTLSRTVGDGERQSYNQGMGRISQLLTPKEKKGLL